MPSFIKYIKPTVQLIQSIAATPQDWTSQPQVEAWIDGYKSPEAQLIALAVGDFLKAKAGVLAPEVDDPAALTAAATAAGAKEEELDAVVFLARTFGDAAVSPVPVQCSFGVAALGDLDWGKIQKIVELILTIIGLLK